eukprot:CAMPEP_0171651802 /NCGR_PEP_ID=MMETSP0990-20121206/38553_1 /TAXON_ID=483369 /ORGANISM="non described non described, Strain CCMP2098" /LENGTH=44 /DNA_ID= /DNA_START= /DNA_END= /DNA_ORIENTATION=
MPGCPPRGAPPSPPSPELVLAGLRLMAPPAGFLAGGGLSIARGG